MKIIIIITLVSAVFCFNTLFANYNKEIGDSLFEEANRLYENGDVSKANSIYKELAVDDNISSVDLYYNLATSYDVLGERGNAILWYERLLFINPFDKEALSRLSLIVEGYSNNLKFAFILVHIFLYIFLLLFTMSAVLFLLSIVNMKYKIVMRKLCYISVVVSAVFLLFTGISQMYYNKGYVITTRDNTSLYKGNNLLSDSLKVLNEGSKLEILEEYDVWFYVKMKNGEKGWVYKPYSEKI